jgi:hypothetical protein
VGLSMLDLLALAASTRQIHQGRGASGANPKARVQASASMERSPRARLVDLGPMTALGLSGRVCADDRRRLRPYFHALAAGEAGRVYLK